MKLFGECLSVKLKWEREKMEKGSGEEGEEAVKN